MEYAGRSWFYQFKILPSACAEDRAKRYANRLEAQFASQTKNWEQNLNTEWTVRVFAAAKMVLGASIMAQSLKYAEARNLRPVISYLRYYTVLHSLRAVMLTTPTHSWNGGEILVATHSKSMNVAISVLMQFDKALGLSFKEEITHLKALRELISYRAPSSGDRYPRPGFDVLEASALLLEIAQFQSELLEASVLKNAAGPFLLDPALTRSVCDIEIDGLEFNDDEDCYRIGYLARKHPAPTNILHILAEGHVEDFFGSWCEDNPKDGHFDPDDNWRILFDVP